MQISEYLNNVDMKIVLLALLGAGAGALIGQLAAESADWGALVGFMVSVILQVISDRSFVARP